MTRSTLRTVAAVRDGKIVAVFSLEMSSSSLLTRLLCAAARVDQHKFRIGFLSGDERRKLQFALADLTDAPLFLDDTAGGNRTRSTRAYARRLEGMVSVELK